MRLESRYVGRYILADGTPRAFVAYAFNRADAAASIALQARESLGDAYRHARAEGVERVQVFRTPRR